MAQKVLLAPLVLTAKTEHKVQSAQKVLGPLVLTAKTEHKVPQALTDKTEREVRRSAGVDGAGRQAPQATQVRWSRWCGRPAGPATYGQRGLQGLPGQAGADGRSIVGQAWMAMTSSSSTAMASSTTWGLSWGLRVRAPLVKR